jgi:hypothetical protein
VGSAQICVPLSITAVSTSQCYKNIVHPASEHLVRISSQFIFKMPLTVLPTYSSASTDEEFDEDNADMGVLSLKRSFSPRDVLLVALGAFAMHLFSGFSQFYPTGYTTTNVVTVDTHVAPLDGPAYKLDSPGRVPVPLDLNAQGVKPPPIVIDTPSSSKGVERVSDVAHAPLDLSHVPLPETRILQHAPGWTIFENIYMSNGTLFVLSEKGKEAFPGGSSFFYSPLHIS